MNISKTRLALLIGLAGGLLLTLVIVSPMLLISMPSFLSDGRTSVDCEDTAQVEEVSDSGAADIPGSYLDLYKEHGEQIGVQWNILAAVGKRETNHGRSDLPGVKSGTNSAGAAGPMQFLISTWGGKARIPMSSTFNGYASDGDGDGVGDVYNPADAILGAAKMLKRNGAPENVRQALFVYNRAWWYVDQVVEIARKYAKSGDVQVPPQAEEECDDSLVEAAPSDIVAKILQYALAQRGKPYLWGGTGPDSFDCSGVIFAAYRAAGLSIPRTTFGQWPFGVKILEGQEQPGDLVFFNAGPGTSPGNPGHVGLVVSKGEMLEARCTLCGPIKVTSYEGRDSRVGFTRPLQNPDVLDQLKRLDNSSL
ncbi:bifunctional lytic transglycosylase/C40 family peptidase [Nonomuraea sp. K274]|uniref:Bifunctional lytic transglycosylase/C40 family peptidase n=1 Tax=Nonomuraea cypriaca TaxID=1187855 RepID=A0A931F733_9ACTN|nr:bifunctional lytic transglycosylase/C40 family peptidase [Nonomuraea cypriaca]MBF8193943.1 bifunctional lytic transglycosylase/C40 family peptidase [Nonomuraea cypriaca]